MKRTALNLLLTLACVAALTAVATAALATNLMTVKIPFDFNIGKQTLPAGTYTVSRANSTGLLILRDDKLTKSVAFIVNTNQATTVNEKAQVDFRRYGDQYFLARIKQGHSGNNFDLMKSRRERQAENEAKNLARNQPHSEIVSVYGN